MGQTRGSAAATGDTPCAVPGCTTTISVDSNWSNETYSILGNVSILAGVSLQIHNSVLIFEEPSVGSQYAFGFNLSGPAAALRLLNGSVVTQVPVNGSAWFLHRVATAIAVASNTTIDAPSARYVAGEGAFGASMRGLEFSWFNFSQYNGFRDYGINGSLNASGGASHSAFLGGTYEGFILGNDSFRETQVGVFAGDIANGSGKVVINDTAFYNLSNNASLYVAEQPGLGVYNPGLSHSVGVATIYLVRDLWSGWNASYQADGEGYGYGVGPQELPVCQADGNSDSLTVAENNTISGVWALAAEGSQGSYLLDCHVNSTVGAGWSAVSVLKHNSIFRGWAKSGGKLSTQMLGTNLTYEYNLISGLATYGGTEFSPVVAYGTNYRIMDNEFFNVTSNVSTPLYDWNQFRIADYGWQIYSIAHGCLNMALAYCGLPDNPSVQPYPPLAGGLANGLIHLVSGNWFVNLTGQEEAFQLTGYGDTFENNTIVNVDSAAALGVSYNSGAWWPVIEENSVYGLYNYSYGLGSHSGGDYFGLYSENYVVDVDNTSYSYWSTESNETFSGVNGTILISNSNGTHWQTGTPVNGYHGRTSDVTLEKSNITQLVMGASAQSLTLNRTPIPADFNLTFTDCYIPPSFQFFSATNGSTFGAVNAQTWSATQPANPSWLNLSGWVGFYPEDMYYVNSSSVRGESELPAYVHGYEVAEFPSSSTSIIYGFEYVSPTADQVVRSSFSAPAITLVFETDKPYSTYLAQATIGNLTFSLGSVESNGSGELVVAYGPLLPTGEANVTISYVGPGPRSGPVVGTASFLLTSFGAGAAVLVATMAVFLTSRKRKRTTTLHGVRKGPVPQPRDDRRSKRIR